MRILWTTIITLVTLLVIAVIPTFAVQEMTDEDLDMQIGGIYPFGVDPIMMKMLTQQAHAGVVNLANDLNTVTIQLTGKPISNNIPPRIAAFTTTQMLLQRSAFVREQLRALGVFLRQNSINR